MIPGFLISFLTFPGVILHEFAHKKFCNWFDVKVLEVNYFTHSGNGYVIHEKPKDFRSIFWISMGPLVINSVSCFVFGLVTALQVEQNSFLFYLAGWLAVSFGAHSFPSDHDAEHILRESKVKIKNKESFLHYFSYPFVGLIKIANLLRFLWVDFLWAFLIIGLAYNLSNQIHPQDNAGTSNPLTTTEQNLESLRVGDYVCSPFHVSESEKIEPNTEDKADIKRRENKLRTDDLYLEALAGEIEYMYVDEYLQESIDRYNSKVNFYNEKSEELKNDHSLYSYKLTLYNERVKKYNDYLEKNCETTQK